MEPQKRGIIILISYFVLILILFVPTRTKDYEADAIYQETEEYTDVVPYEVEESYKTKEAYIDKETYEDLVPLTRDVKYTEEETYYEKSFQTGCDSEKNCFCTDITYVSIPPECIECICQRSRTVDKYRKEIAYETITKTRPVLRYKDVIKKRKVTRYKDIKKQRTIAKVRSEKRQRNTNWIFGFIVPWKIELF